MDANSRKKVLVVEDDAIIRDLCLDVLGAAGYETDGAVDGAAGLEKIKNNAYDLIISDLYMPVLGGISMYINAVWENAGLRERFLFITGNTSDDARAVMTQMNIKYLVKPFKILDLLGCAESIMERADLLDRTDKHGTGKRMDVRFSLHKECVISGDGEDASGFTRSGKTSDLSRNGLKVVYEGQPFAPRTQLSVLIKINTVSLRRGVSVVWSHGLDEIYSVSGMSFMRAMPVQPFRTALRVH